MSTAIESPANPASHSRANASVQFISFAIGVDQYGVDIMVVQGIKAWSLAGRVLDIISVDPSQIQPVPRQRGGRIDVLSGLVTVEGNMIALIGPDRLTEGQIDDEATAAQPAALGLATGG